MESALESEKMQRLVTKVEEATRSSREGVRNFVPPAQGVLDRALAKRHHIIFGRRGSGKSSLLEKAASDLTVDRRPIAKVDLEAFKGHAYPDVLLSVLIRTFDEFRKWLESAAINPANKTSFWHKLFGSVPKRKAFNRKEAEGLAESLLAQIVELKGVLNSADAATINVTKNEERREDSEATGAAGIKFPHANVSREQRATTEFKQSEGVSEAFALFKDRFSSPSHTRISGRVSSHGRVVEWRLISVAR